MFYRLNNGVLESINDIDLYYVDHDFGWYFFNTDEQAKEYFGLLEEDHART